MAGDKRLQPIIIKKIQGGHGGAHGGAWKVAFADFMTAMMAFFLVMWLMGSDEETKAAIADYFNNPTAAWRLDMSSKTTLPLGERAGAGDNVLSGNEGQVPQDLVDRPSRKLVPTPENADEAGSVASELVSSDKMTFELVKLTIPEDQLFEQGSSEKWSPSAKAVLEKLGTLARKYNGHVSIRGTFNPQAGDPSHAGSYEFQLSRAVAVEKYLVEHRYTAEDKVKTQVTELARNPASEGPAKRRLEFTLIPPNRD